MRTVRQLNDGVHAKQRARCVTLRDLTTMRNMADKHKIGYQFGDIWRKVSLLEFFSAFWSVYRSLKSYFKVYENVGS